MAVSAASPVINAGASAASVTTASFTPTADDLLIAFCVARGASATIPTISDSQGGTWEPIGAGIDQGFVTARLFARKIGSTPSAVTVTVNSGAGTQTGVMIYSSAGAGTDFTNFQAESSLGTAHAVTMSPYAAGSRVMTFMIINSGTAQAAPTGGFSEIHDTNLATNVRCQTAHASSAASTSISWTSNNSDTICFAVEIKEPVSNHEFNDYDEPNSPHLVSPYPAAGGTVETLFALFGPAFTGRTIAALVVINDAASTIVALDSVTIGGINATLTPISGVNNAYVVTAVVPTGTEGDIVFTPTTPGTIAKLESLGVFALAGVDPSSAVSAASFSGTSVTFDVPANGQAFIYARGTGDHIGDLVGLDLDGDQWTADNRTLAWASRTFTGAVTGHSVNFVDDSGAPLMVWAVFSPAAESPTGSVVKVHVGGVDQVGVVRVYLGAVWVAKPLKTFKASDWY